MTFSLGTFASPVDETNRGEVTDDVIAWLDAHR